MKGSIKKIKSQAPAPIDSIDVIDRVEFEDRFCDLEDYAISVGADVEKMERKIKKLTICCGVAAVALGILMIFRKGD